MLSGVDSKSAIGITSFAEGVTCFVGIVMYMFVQGKSFDMQLAPWLCIGAVLSVPLSAFTVRKVSSSKLKLLIAMITIALGLFTLLKTFMG